MCWWLLSDLKLKYRPANPYAYLCLLWVGVSLGLYLLKHGVAALTMVGIAALPLAVMGIFLGAVMLVSIFKGPIRWN